MRRKTRVAIPSSLGFISFILTILSISLQNFRVVVLFAFSLIVCILSLLKPLREWRRDVDDLELKQVELGDLTDLALDGDYITSGYEIVPRGRDRLDVLLTSREVNSRLWTEVTAPIEINQDTFRSLVEPPMFYVLMKQFTDGRKSVLFNGSKVRLMKDLRLNRARLCNVEVQRTRYFEGLVTNESFASELSLRSRPRQEPVFNGRVQNFPKSTVPTCDNSASSNQIGVSTLAITQDFRLVILQQGEGNVVSAGLASPSGSGSADWHDVRGCQNFNDLIRTAALRELREECGLKSRDIERFKILGYGRLLQRGGIPEFYCLAKLSCDLKNLVIVRAERKLINRHSAETIDVQRNSIGQAISEVTQKLLRDSDVPLSASLWWNLWMLNQVSVENLDEFFLDDDPEIPHVSIGI